MSSYENQEEVTGQDTQQSDLDLNPDIIRNRTETYTSLSDLYDVQLFTDQRVEENRQHRERKEKEEKKVTDGVFINQTAAADVDAQRITELFAEPLVIKKNQDYTGNTAAKTGFFIGGAVLIILVFVVMITGYFKKKKQTKEAEENGYE
ncbi:MAG: hypothetical protein SO445_10830 [Lachnospiraceae bacterium]|nr:hypothetical protein [Lachnospiraceae bacterium]MDD7378890.1 hypothetical protein [Lachnospiraceae bacterium]MDY4618180.1 hypothetical protein [Lachnospiraceae bacterium]